MRRARLALVILAALAVMVIGALTAAGTGPLRGSAINVFIGSSTIPTATCSQQPFCADFETGDLSQWEVQPREGTGVAPSIVTGRVAQGAHAAKFQDTPDSSGSKDRSELYIGRDQAGARPGQEWWYAWWSYFPGPSQSWWDQGTGWNDFAQLNEVNGARWIYAGIDATNGAPKVYIADHNVNHVVTELRYDHWYHFVLHIKWATDSTGLLEAYVDGNQVIAPTAQPTLPADNPQGTWSLGMYRAAWPSTNTVIHDGACRAASYAAAAAC
jgi:Polysaccharide lyase